MSSKTKVPKSKKSIRSFIVGSISTRQNTTNKRGKIKKGSRLQAVVFLPTKKNKWTLAKSKKWIIDHNVKTIKPADVIKKEVENSEILKLLKSSKTKNKKTSLRISQIRYRVQDPDQFESFSTKKNDDLDINFIIGFTKKKTQSLKISNIMQSQSKLTNK